MKHRNDQEKIAHDRLLSLLSYDPRTGLFTWIAKGYGIRKGRIAGTRRKNKPGVRLKIDGQEYPAAMIAFFYMTKRWAPFDVDHKDGDPDNNAWINLREATRSQNIANKRNVPHSSPYKGVTWDKQTNKWRVQIKINERGMSLGRFVDIEDARSAYEKAAKSYFGEFACFRDETVNINPNPLPERPRRSPYKGVRFIPSLNKWRVQYKKHKGTLLGYYDDFKTARQIYDEFAARNQT